MSYGHDSHGINMSNLKATHEPSRKYRSVGGFRPPFDWELESKEECKMGATMKGVSATLRMQSEEVQAFASSKTKASEDRVTEALKSRLGKLGAVKHLLESEIVHTEVQITKMAVNKEYTEKQLAKQRLALDLNQRKLVLRESRPARETVHDEVQSRLISQQRALQSNIDKLSRCVATNVKDAGKLREDRAVLEADLGDKNAALGVDEGLMATVNSTMFVEGQLQKSTTTYPHKWIQSSEAEVKRARARHIDAGRLRGAIGNVINESKYTTKESDKYLKSAVQNKIHSTQSLTRELEGELAAVRGEQARAYQRQAELEAALEEKVEPLALGRQRYQMRHARPSREKVHDEVEDALASEFNDLKFVCSQLERKIAAVKGEAARLASHAAVLEANIKDKVEALAADRAVLYLDNSDASSTVTSLYQHSVASSAATARSGAGSRVQAKDRIARLEEELEAARAARLHMEAELDLTLKTGR